MLLLGPNPQRITLDFSISSLGVYWDRAFWLTRAVIGESTTLVCNLVLFSGY